MDENRYEKMFGALLGEDSKLGVARYVALHLAKVILYELKGLDSLEENTKSLARNLLEYADTIQCPMFISEAFRAAAKQDAYYRQGRSVAGVKVTNAEALQSYHQFGLAFDLLPITGAGKLKPDVAYAHLGAWWEQNGGVWGGHFGDYGHFEYHPGFSWNDLIDIFKYEKLP